MKGMKGFTRRNILVFFRNRQTVFFSMLAPLIVFALYVLFLRGNYLDSIMDSMGELKSVIKSEDIDGLVNGLLLSGIIGSSIITVPYGTLQIIVEDREKLKDRDILATPMTRWQIILGYFAASAICALCVTMVLLTVGLAVLNAMGNMYWAALDVASLYAETILGTLSSTAISMVLMLLFKSSSACGAFQGILTAASGFVIGAYIPVSQFSDTVQTFCSLWPASGICCLLRGSLLNGLLDHLNTELGGIDQGQFTKSIRQVFGFKANVGGSAMNTGSIILYVAVVSAVCLVIDAVIYARVYKRK